MPGLRERIDHYLQRRWYGNSANPLLQPLGWCYGQVVKRRRARAEPRHLPTPLVVVGNLTVGGTGKSPLVIALAKLLQSRDYHPAILSRGYGGRAATYPLRVREDTPVVEAGDEALLLAQSLDCPVLVDPDRVRGACALIREENPDLILVDDGLQHYALQRDLELLVIDGSRGLGNRRLLPAGPLREPVGRLDEVDLVLCNGSSAGLEPDLQACIDHDFVLRPTGWRHLASGERYALAQRPFGTFAHAVAGIGNPQRFFASLQQLGLDIEPHPRADHHAYQRTDLPDDGRPVLMTTKDAVKCRAFATANWWVLEVAAELPEALQNEFLQRCDALISRSAE